MLLFGRAEDDPVVRRRRQELCRDRNLEVDDGAEREWRAERREVRAVVDAVDREREHGDGHARAPADRTADHSIREPVRAHRALQDRD